MPKKLMVVAVWLMLFCMPAIAEEKIYYFVSLDYEVSTSKLSLSDVSLVEGEDELSDAGMPTYRVELFSFNEKLIYNTTYYMVPSSYDIFPLAGLPEPEAPEYEKISIMMPYFKNGKEIVVTDLATRESVKVDVSELASCNEDKICDISEGIRSCPEDCAAETESDGLIGQVPASKISDVEVPIESEGGSIYKILGVTFVLLIIILAILLRKRNIYK
ncbi:MAG: hypothetical protein V1906_00160 [Candidatus Woesearchaeota archaeon]